MKINLSDKKLFYALISTAQNKIILFMYNFIYDF